MTLRHGDALEVLRALPDQSVDCCITSPPYFGLRDYGVAGQLGAEGSPAEFVARLVEVFAEVRRVLADDGTCWVNLGDCYSSSNGHTDPNGTSTLVGTRSAGMVPNRTGSRADLPRKNLLGIPWRTAFALQDDGWILRNSIVWAKPNAMPESISDRLSTKHELIFLLAKSRRYWFDLDPIRETPVTARADALTWNRPEQGTPGQKPQHRPGRAGGTNMRPTGRQHLLTTDKGRNPGDVWTIPTVPFPGAHFAVMPPEIPRRAIQAGCRPGGTVLDPFSGSGTTGMVAQQLGRRYVGIDLNAEYLDLSLRTRLGAAALPDVAGDR